MKNKIIKKIIIIFSVIFIISSTQVFATITPKDIDGSATGIEYDTTFEDDITELIQKIGTFLAVGVLMIIGIRYVLR